MSTDKTRAEQLADALQAIADSGVDSVSARMCCRSAFLELSRQSASEAALLEALEAMVECSHTMDIRTCANASQLARDLIARTKEARNG